MFCVLPFISANITAYGTIGACCFDYSSSELFSNDILSSNYLKTVRNQILLGNNPEFCNTCINEEKNGIISYRQFRNNEFKNHNEYIQSPRLDFLYVGFGRQCNSGCMTCSSIFSTGIENKLNTLFKLDSSNKKPVIPIVKNWINEDEKFKELIKISKNVKYIKIIGGEPFMSPKLKEYLTSIHDNVEKLYLVTNGMFYDYETVKILNSIKECHLTVSVDDIGLKDNFIRGIKNGWDIKIENIRRFTNELNCASKNINTVLSVLNLGNYNNILENLDLKTFTESGKFHLTLEHRNMHYHCNHEYLKWAYSKYSDLQQFSGIKNYILNGLNFSGKRNEKEILDWVKKQETFTEINIKDVFPEFYSFHLKNSIY